MLAFSVGCVVGAAVNYLIMRTGGETYLQKTKNFFNLNYRD